MHCQFDNSKMVYISMLADETSQTMNIKNVMFLSDHKLFGIYRNDVIQKPVHNHFLEILKFPDFP